MVGKGITRDVGLTAEGSENSGRLFHLLVHGTGEECLGAQLIGQHVEGSGGLGSQEGEALAPRGLLGSSIAIRRWWLVGSLLVLLLCRGGRSSSNRGIVVEFRV